MNRLVCTLILAAACMTGLAHAEECTEKVYTGLVQELKNADANRLWDNSEELSRRILGECLPLMAEGDLVKLYDSLSVGLLMQGKYGDAIETAKKCIEQDARYNACMMTAAKGSEGLGDMGMAAQFAREAIEVGGYDDYSAATVIYAKDFLRRIEGRKQ